MDIEKYNQGLDLISIKKYCNFFNEAECFEKICAEQKKYSASFNFLIKKASMSVLKKGIKITINNNDLGTFNQLLLQIDNKSGNKSHEAIYTASDVLDIFNKILVLGRQKPQDALLFLKVLHEKEFNIHIENELLMHKAIRLKIFSLYQYIFENGGDFEKMLDKHGLTIQEMQWANSLVEEKNLKETHINKKNKKNNLL